MVTAFIAISAVLLDFAVGFAAGRLLKRPPRPKQTVVIGQQDVRINEKQAAEYRNFLNYDGTEQPDVE